MLKELELPIIDLPAEDGEPLESNWHRAQINLLIDSQINRDTSATNYFAGGNMFLYYSFDQVRNRDYRGPDFFVVLGVDGTRDRESWVVWEEGGRYPNVIVELLSPSTADDDKTTKKVLYEQTFRTPNYYCYDPSTRELVGWQLTETGYKDIIPDENGWLWCSELGLWLGTWKGKYLGQWNTWLRFYDTDGRLMLTAAEEERQRAEEERQRAEEERQRAEEERQRAEEERQRAEEERQRADAAETAIETLRAQLRRAGIDPDTLQDEA